ncbi:MAG TPA: rRNA pseudouridine synthase [Firmicutes bacterium]|nr:rRNA pseudouridine synthase [Bacillota bacterium]
MISEEEIIVKERLQKAIARAGICSRRRAEELIISGRVKVNDVVITQLGQKVDPENDIIKVDNNVLNLRVPKVYLLLHKPPGYITTVHDPHGRPTVMDLIPKKVRLFPVGRLDLNSEGLLILTNDGRLAHMLTHPRFEVTKTYEVWVKGQPQANKLLKLTTGIVLEDGLAHAKRVSIVGTWTQGTRLDVVMAEGRKREVRRLFQAIGFPVQRLIRHKLGPLSLGQLPLGHTRSLTKEEVAALYRAAGQASS